MLPQIQKDMGHRKDCAKPGLPLFKRRRWRGRWLRSNVHVERSVWPAVDCTREQWRKIRSHICMAKTVREKKSVLIFNSATTRLTPSIHRTSWKVSTEWLAGRFSNACATTKVCKDLAKSKRRMHMHSEISFLILYTPCLLAYYYSSYWRKDKEMLVACALVVCHLNDFSPWNVRRYVGVFPCPAWW